MALRCQLDSYLQECSATVRACTAVSGTELDIELDDTILFPEGQPCRFMIHFALFVEFKVNLSVELPRTSNEVLTGTDSLFQGGGQPDDRGFINALPVVAVQRKGARVVHRVTGSEVLLAGAEVKLRVDWARRWDHMQQVRPSPLCMNVCPHACTRHRSDPAISIRLQHSGQHLITAIIDRRFSFKTVSWNLGDTTSFIDLNAKEMTADQVAMSSSHFGIPATRHTPSPPDYPYRVLLIFRSV